MKKRHFLTMLGLGMTLMLHAVPVEPYTTQLRLIDGTIITATYMGDERASFYVSADGYIVSPSAISSNLYEKTSLTPRQYLDALQAESELTAPMQYSVRAIGSTETAAMQPIGKPKIPVILVEFSDKSFSVASTTQEILDFYEVYYNGTKESITGSNILSYGSVRQYFDDMSDGKLTPEFHIYGPVKLSKPSGYYGEDSPDGTHDIHFNEFRTEALQLVLQEHSDFEELYDNNGDGKVDAVFYLYAGFSQNERSKGASDSDIWPKFFSSTIYVDNVAFASASASGELTITKYEIQSDGTKKPTAWRENGVGTCLHELCHVFGMPDTYDINYKQLGMSYWSLMDYGNYVRNGLYPSSLTAYERDFMGWQSLETIDKDTTLTLQPLERGGKGYKIVNPVNPAEYFILENRQNERWDTGLCSMFGGGLLITHCIYNASAWQGNAINTATGFQRLGIVPANNTAVTVYNATSADELISSIKGHVYPGPTPNTTFTAQSTPAAEFLTTLSQENVEVKQKSQLHLPLTEITQLDNGDISVKIGNPVTPPTAIGEVQIDQSPLNARLYTFNGQLVTSHYDGTQHLSAGVYIVKPLKGTPFKLVVR